MCIRTKEFVTPCVKGFDRSCGIPVRNQSINAPLHFLGRALSKSERQDLFWFGALFGDEPGHTARDDLSLSGTRTCNNKERPLAVGNGSVLLVV